MELDRNAPATKGDIHDAVEQLRSEMNHVHNDLVERITDSETRLLKAFYSFGQTNSKRMIERLNIPPTN